MSKILFFAFSVAVMLALPCLVLAQATSPQATGELQAAVARTGEFRRKAVDFEGNYYFPSEWIVAEALYAEAGLIPIDTDYNINRAIDAYTMVANSFASIARLAIPLYAQAREDEIMMIRHGLVAGNARASFPELMVPADRAALAAMERYEAGDYYSARDLAAKAYAMFRVLETTFSAWQMRQEIVRRGFMHYAQDNYERAEAIIGEAMQAYIEGDFPLAQKNATEAQARYTLVLSSGWAAVAEYNSSIAKAERIAAMEARANVAARETFKMADSFYHMAIDSLRREYYREAAEMFADAESLYFIARVSTLERRRFAAEAIMEANRQIKEVIRTAQQAELDTN